MEIFKKNKIAQLQVGYMSYPVLNHNKAIKDQIDKNLGMKFDKIKMITIRKVLKKDNTSAF